MQSARGVPGSDKDAREYMLFCRFRRLFLVDGLEAWRKALQQRRLSDAELSAKVAAAAQFVRRLGEV